MTVTALSVLKSYFTSDDEVIKNKYYDALELFFYKSEGEIISSHTIGLDDIKVTLSGGTLLTFPSLPESVAKDFVDELSQAFLSKVSTIQGKAVNTNDCTDELNHKLGEFHNYIQPRLHQTRTNGLAIENRSSIDASDNVHSIAIQSSSTSLSNPFGGSTEQPNLLGIQTYAQYHIGDGTTVTYDITPPFIVQDLSPRISIRANVLRKSDGVLLTSIPTINSGYGTNTVTVTVSTALDIGDLLEFTIYGENDDVNATATLITTNGYDNSVNAIMSNAYGAHGIIFPGNGHNSILGGSYGRIWGSFNEASGSGVFIGRRDHDSFSNYGYGLGIQLDGSFNSANGSNIDIQGNRCSAVGSDHQSEGFDNVHFSGRKGLGVSNDEKIHAAGRKSDESIGLYQTREVILRGETNTSSKTNLSLAIGNSIIGMPNNSCASVEVIICCSYIEEIGGIGSAYSHNSVTFKDEFNFTKINDVVKVDNSASDVEINKYKSIFENTYKSYLRALSGGLVVRVEGDSNKVLRWVGKLNITQTKFTI